MSRFDLSRFEVVSDTMDRRRAHVSCLERYKQILFKVFLQCIGVQVDRNIENLGAIIGRKKVLQNVSATNISSIHL